MSGLIGNLALFLASSAVDVDGDFADVLLLLHANGANGSTSFVDSSSYAHAISIVEGSPVISTAESVFGGSSLQLPNSALSSLGLSSANFQFAAGQPFTVDGWIFPTNAPGGTAVIFGVGAPGAGPGNAPVRAGWLVTLDAAFRLGLFMGDPATAYNGVNLTTGLTPGAWHFFRIIADGLVQPKIFVGSAGGAATPQALTAVSGTNNWPSIVPAEPDSAVAFIGRYDALVGTPDKLPAYLDDFRIKANANGFALSSMPVPNLPFYSP